MPEIMYEKLTPEFYVIFSQKNNKILEFYMTVARKIFFRISGGGGACAPSRAPVSYGYGDRRPWGYTEGW